MRTTLAPTLVLLALLPGCGGGQTGDLSGKNGTNGSTTNEGGGCVDQASGVSLSDASGLGFNAESVLAFAAKRFDAPFDWLATAGVSYSPGAGQSALALTLTPLGTAELVHSTPAPVSGSEGGGTIDIGALCPPDRLKIAVHAELTTADGALAESFDDYLEATNGAIASFAHELDLTALHGTFAIQQLSPGGASSSSGTSSAVQRFTFAASLAPAGVAGTLTGQLVSSSAQVASASSLTFGSFPDDPACPAVAGFAPQIPVPADEHTLGPSGSEAVASLNAWGPLPLTWAGGGSTELTLALSALGVGCLQAPGLSGGAQQSQPGVIYPVILSASTKDGQLQGSYAASLGVQPAADGGGYAESLSLNQQFALANAAQAGFSGVTIPDGTQRLGLGFTSVFNGTSASGNIALNALSDPPCVTNPAPPMGNSSEGCSGTLVTALASGSWGQP